MAKLIRQRDNLVKEGVIEFVEFDEFDYAKAVHSKPKIKYSCVVNGRRLVLTWMTSQITEVVSDTEFYTKNSHYKIEL